jgi:thioredoxin family protein
MAKRTVEVFTAGCGLCNDTLARVRQLACESCDVQVHDLTSDAGMAKARAYGVTRAPSVVVNGQLADCCRQGAVDDGVLRELGVGVRS